MSAAGNDVPILFNDAMVRAILDGRKRETRRPVKPQPEWVALPSAQDGVASSRATATAPWMRGDRLWVREAFRLPEAADRFPPSYVSGAAVWWEASGPHAPTAERARPGKLRPSIHMPRWASRITLPVEEVRIEPLCAGFTKDAVTAEGFACLGDFIRAWDGIYTGPIGVEANPWVWVCRFGEPEVRCG